MHDARQWYVVRTKPRREEYAQEQLVRRDVETFLPRILETGTRGEPVVSALFPGYLFAHIDLLTQYTRVSWTPGVRSFVAFGDVPNAVDRGVIDFLQERCGPCGLVQALPTFQEGDQVRVKRGPLGGLVGIVRGHVSGRCRVQVLMELLRRRTEVSVPVDLLEHADC